MKLRPKYHFTYYWIYGLVCQYFGFTVAEISLPGKPKKEQSRIKQIAQYMIWSAGGSCRIAGEVVGGHTAKSVSYSINRVRDLITPINGKVLDYDMKKDIDILTILTNKP